MRCDPARGDLVLAARRAQAPDPSRPGQRWEYPGGKVEPGESRDEALVREIAEELGCVVAVERWLEAGVLADGVPISPTLRLHVAVVRLVEGEPVPREREHDAVLWLSRDELHRVDWLEPDLPFVAALQRGE